MNLGSLYPLVVAKLTPHTIGGDLEEHLFDDIDDFWLCLDQKDAPFWLAGFETQQKVQGAAKGIRAGGDLPQKLLSRNLTVRREKIVGGDDLLFILQIVMEDEYGVLIGDHPANGFYVCYRENPLQLNRPFPRLDLAQAAAQSEAKRLLSSRRRDGLTSSDR